MVKEDGWKGKRSWRQKFFAVKNNLERTKRGERKYYGREKKE